MQKEEDESSFYADIIFSDRLLFLPCLKWRELFSCAFKAKFLLSVKSKKFRKVEWKKAWVFNCIGKTNWTVMKIDFFSPQVTLSQILFLCRKKTYPRQSSTVSLIKKEWLLKATIIIYDSTFISLMRMVFLRSRWHR